MTSVVISQPMYFPWPGFFEQVKLADVYIWLDDVQFSKGSFTNRVQVRLPGKKVWMTIPLRSKTGRQIGELEADGEGWIASHRDLLRQSFQGSPHADMAMKIFDQAMQEKTLCGRLIASVEAVAKELAFTDREVLRSSEMKVDGSGSERVLSLVKNVGGTRYITGHGAAKYLDHEAFERAGVAVEYMNYSKTPWPQTGEPFDPYVNILDLLASTGDQADSYLRPGTVPWREFVAGEAG